VWSESETEAALGNVEVTVTVSIQDTLRGNNVNTYSN